MAKMSKKAAIVIAGLAAAGLVAYDKWSSGLWVWEKPPFTTARKLTTDQKIQLRVQQELNRREAARLRAEKEKEPTGRYVAQPGGQGWTQRSQRW